MRTIQLLLLMSLTVLMMGCMGQPTALVRTQYGIGVPLLGAPMDLTHTANAGVGLIGTEDGWQNGVEIGTRFRFGGAVMGGTFPELNLLTAYSTDDAPIFGLNTTGVGVFGTTSMEKPGYDDVGNTFDILSPHTEFAMGVPVGAGLAVSAGVSLELLWHVWDDRHFGTQLIMNGTVGFGFFDPTTSPADHALCPTFCE